MHARCMAHISAACLKDSLYPMPVKVLGRLVTVLTEEARRIFEAEVSILGEISRILTARLVKIQRPFPAQ